MTDEEKAIEKMKEVAELDEIPAGTEFNEDRAWAKIQLGLEKQRASKLPRRVLIFLLVVVLAFVAVAIAVRLNYHSGDMVPPKPEQKKTSSVDLSTKINLYESSIQKRHHWPLHYRAILQAASKNNG